MLIVGNTLKYRKYTSYEISNLPPNLKQMIKNLVSRGQKKKDLQHIFVIKNLSRQCTHCL